MLFLKQQARHLPRRARSDRACPAAEMAGVADSAPKTPAQVIVEHDGEEDGVIIDLFEDGDVDETSPAADVAKMDPVRRRQAHGRARGNQFG